MTVGGTRFGGINRPRVSVLVPCHNDGAYIHETIASIREDEQVETIVVDDASTDADTVTALADIERTGVIVLRNERNQGVSVTRTRAFASASAPFVFPLDADDLLVEGTLGAMA